MTVSIRQGDFAAFFQAPFAGYGQGSPYVSPLRADLRRFLDRARNPLFADPGSDLAYFSAHRGARVLGRITAHVHGASNRAQGIARGYFGYFDCADDAEAARALLTAAENWCRARQLTEIAGNFNLTAMQQIGVVTDGFGHAPATDLMWSPPHVARLLAANGYAPQFGMTTYEVDLTTATAPPVSARAQALLDDPATSFAPITRATIAQRMQDARAVLNASFADNPMFVPVSAAEFDFQAKDMKWVMDTRISAVLHHGGRPVAASIVVPDLNPFLRRTGSRLGLTAPWHYIRHRMTNRRAVLIYSGVMPEFQGQGVHPALMARVLRALQGAGYTRLANTWIADVNGPSLAQTEKAGARPMHRLHLFGKTL